MKIMYNPTHSILSTYFKIPRNVYAVDYQVIYYDITVASCFHEVRHLISFVF